MFESAIYYTVLVLEAIVGVVGIRLYEEPPYQIVETLPSDAEVRRYSQRIAAEVTLPRGTDDRTSGAAFQALFDYIAGANRQPDGRQEKIAMTTPVEVRDSDKVAMTTPVQTTADDKTLRMRFFLPSRYTLETAPTPTDERVKIVTVPAETFAVVRFSGRVRELVPIERRQQLAGALAGSKWRPSTEPFLLTYDAPFTVPFLRRNEAAVEVEPRVPSR